MPSRTLPGRRRVSKSASWPIFVWRRPVSDPRSIRRLTQAHSANVPDSRSGRRRPRQKLPVWPSTVKSARHARSSHRRTRSAAHRVRANACDTTDAQVSARARRRRSSSCPGAAPGTGRAAGPPGRRWLGVGDPVVVDVRATLGDHPPGLVHAGHQPGLLEQRGHRRQLAGHGARARPRPARRAASPGQRRPANRGRTAPATAAITWRSPARRAPAWSAPRPAPAGRPRAAGRSAVSFSSSSSSSRERKLK